MLPTSPNSRVNSRVRAAILGWGWPFYRARVLAGFLRRDKTIDLGIGS